MTTQSIEAKAGPMLMFAAVYAVLSTVFAIIFFAGIVTGATGWGWSQALTAFGIGGLLVAGPTGIALSLLVRCHACDKLILPLLYDGRTLFSQTGPSVMKIGRATMSILTRKQCGCPHCGAHVEV